MFRATSALFLYIADGDNLDIRVLEEVGQVAAALAAGADTGHDDFFAGGVLAEDA